MYNEVRYKLERQGSGGVELQQALGDSGEKQHPKRKTLFPL